MQLMKGLLAYAGDSPRRNVRVSDPAAHSFTRAFYLALAVGETVRDAYDIAKQVGGLRKIASFDLGGV
eukprot:scaffold121752_cov29-Tisochrysis_lutea.AAC.5